MLLRQFCKLHFVTKQFHVNRCTLLFLLQRIKYKALSRSYQYFLRCRQKVNEKLVSRYLLNKNFHDSVSVYFLWKGGQSFLLFSKALYNEGWMRGSWTLPLVWPLFFVTFPLVWAPVFRGLFLAFPWYGPYLCVINLSFDAFFHFQKSLLLVNFRSNQKYEASTTIDEEAVESNNISWVRCLNETVCEFLNFPSHKKWKTYRLLNWIAWAGRHWTSCGTSRRTSCWTRRSLVVSVFFPWNWWGCSCTASPRHRLGNGASWTSCWFLSSVPVVIRNFAAEPGRPKKIK